MISEHPNDIGTFMVAVGAVVENPDTGKILLLQRANDNYKANHWEVGYGRMDQGEDPEAALKREFFEETGIQDLRTISILSSWHFYRGEEEVPENEVIGITYWTQSTTSKIKISREHQAYKWVTPEEALKMVEVDRIRRDIQAYLDTKAFRDDLNQAKEKEQRIAADYQNLVRRTREERGQAARLAARDLVEDLVQPLEHLSLAARQIEDPGLDMVKSQLWQALAKHGLEEINPLGQKFDLETMEAVEKQGSGDIVVGVVRSGFRLNGEVIHHAKVTLGKPGDQ